MNSRLKITDGDLILIHVGKHMDCDDEQECLRMFRDWCQKRGLNEVKLILINTGEDHGFRITVLSVNDVFEDTVLSGRQ